MASGTPELSGLLSGLLENPAAMAAITGLLGGMRGAAESEQKEAPCEEAEKKDGAVQAAAAPLPGTGRGAGRHSEREHLLRALAPYLSPPRRRALEGASKLIEVLELFRKP